MNTNLLHSVVVMQSEKNYTFHEFKVALRDFEENEKVFNNNGHDHNVMRSSFDRIVCYSCNNEGHKANSCPNKPTYCNNCKTNSHKTEECRKNSKNKYKHKKKNNNNDKAKSADSTSSFNFMVDCNDDDDISFVFMQFLAIFRNSFIFMQFSAISGDLSPPIKFSTLENPDLSSLL